MTLKLYCTFFCNLLVNLHGYLTESSYARILLNHAILQLAILICTQNSTPKNSYLQLPFSSTLSPDPVAPYRLYFSVLHVFYKYMYT